MKKTIFIMSLSLWGIVVFGSPLPDFPFVYSEGEATTNVAPDKAVITFNVKVFHERSDQAVKIIQDRMQKIANLVNFRAPETGVLVSYQLHKRQITTYGTYSSRGKTDDNEVVGYEISRLMELTLNDLSKYEGIIKTLFEMDNVEAINTKFTQRNSKEIQRELIATACAEAKQNAEAMAMGLEKELGEVYSISENGFGNINENFGFTAKHRSGGLAGFDMIAQPNRNKIFMPTKISFYNQVTVIYELK